MFRCLEERLHALGDRAVRVNPAQSHLFFTAKVPLQGRENATRMHRKRVAAGGFQSAAEGIGEERIRGL